MTCMDECARCDGFTWSFYVDTGGVRVPMCPSCLVEADPARQLDLFEGDR